MTRINESANDSISRLIEASVGIAPLSMQLFCIGSTPGSSRYNTLLSDIDILGVSSASTMKHYESDITAYANFIRRFKDNSGQVIDGFFLSSTVAPSLLAVTQTLVGFEQLGPGRHLYGSDMIIKARPVTDAVRKGLYRAKFRDFLQKLLSEIPEANTQKSRRVSKTLLRCIKVMNCALNDGNLLDLEHRLNKVCTFKGVRSLIESTTVPMPDTSYLEQILAGCDVDDWPLWMDQQEIVLEWLLSEGAIMKEANIRRQRLEGAVVQARDLLLLEVRRIISDFGNEEHTKSIGEFADTTAGILAVLALCGVSSLYDLEDESVPTRVQEAYAIVVSHLQSTKEAGIQELAAAIILLEYALVESLSYCEQIL